MHVRRSIINVRHIACVSLLIVLRYIEYVRKKLNTVSKANSRPINTSCWYAKCFYCFKYLFSLLFKIILLFPFLSLFQDRSIKVLFHYIFSRILNINCVCVCRLPWAAAAKQTNTNNVNMMRLWYWLVTKLGEIYIPLWSTWKMLSKETRVYYINTNQVI